MNELTDDDTDDTYEVIGAPDRIWLCFGDLSQGCPQYKVPFDSCDEVTWCSSQIDNWDMEYVRATDYDAAQARIAHLEGKCAEATRAALNNKDLCGEYHARLAELEARVATLIAELAHYTAIPSAPENGDKP